MQKEEVIVALAAQRIAAREYSIWENDHFQSATGTTKTSGRLLACLTAKAQIVR